MKKALPVTLNVVFFKEGKDHVAFCPSLNLSTCADTLEHCKKSFSEAVSLFFEELSEMGTLEEVLKDCGWKKVNKTMKPPQTIMENEEVQVPCLV